MMHRPDIFMIDPSLLLCLTYLCCNLFASMLGTFASRPNGVMRYIYLLSRYTFIHDLFNQFVCWNRIYFMPRPGIDLGTSVLKVPVVFGCLCCTYSIYPYQVQEKGHGTHMVHCICCFPFMNFLYYLIFLITMGILVCCIQTHMYAYQCNVF